MITDQGWELRLPDGRVFRVTQTAIYKHVGKAGEDQWVPADPMELDGLPDGWQDTARQYPIPTADDTEE